MAWTYTFDTATPTGDDAPAVIDDRIREVKAAVQELQNVDHFWPLDGSTIVDLDCGKHRQITFVTPLTSLPTPDEDEFILFSKDADSIAELYARNETGYYRQLTKEDGDNSKLCLNITIDDFILADTDIVDDDTIEVNSTNGLQLKAGGSGTGILKTHLGTDAGDFVDDDTIEIDGTNGLQIKSRDVPSAGGDSYPVLLEPSLMACGSYTGDADNDLDIVVGAAIRHLVIKCTTHGTTGVEAIDIGYGTFMWRQGSGDLQSSGLTIDNSVAGSEKFTVGSGNAYLNANDSHGYTWFAILERSS